MASPYATYLVPKIDTIELQSGSVIEDEAIKEGIVIAHLDLVDIWFC